MIRWSVGAFLVAGVLALPARAGGQVIRSFSSSGSRDQPAEIPRDYRPPRGMCRIWIDGVPPSQQPAPTDCRAAVRNKPKNARVIYGDDAKGDDKKDKDKPRKP